MSILRNMSTSVRATTDVRPPGDAAENTDIGEKVVSPAFSAQAGGCDKLVLQIRKFTKEELLPCSLED